MSQTRRFTFTTLKAGQARAYGPSRRETSVLVEWRGIDGKEDWRLHPELSEEIVQQVARGFSPWEDPDPEAVDAMTEHFKTKLKFFRNSGPGEWLFRTESAYTG